MGVKSRGLGGDCVGVRDGVSRLCGFRGKCPTKHMVYSVRLAPVTRFGLQIPGLGCKVWVLGMSISREVRTVQSLSICMGFRHGSF